MRPLRILALAVALLAALLAVWQLTRRPRATLYVGGPILTMDAGDRVVEALAVEGERIVQVGSEAELRPWAERRRARVVDLAGRALLPGFIDAHGHFAANGIFAVAVDLRAPPAGEVGSLDVLLARLRARAADGEPGEWIVGFGYDDTGLAEQRHPTRFELDRVSAQQPLAIVHVSGHLAVVSTAGLEALGIDAATPDPEGGRIRRDPRTGEPDGLLEETVVEQLLAVVQPGGLDGLRIVRHAARSYLAAGVTTAQEGWATPQTLRGLTLLARLRLLPLRVVVWPNAEARDALLSGALRFRPPDPRRLRLGATKLVADGSIQGYTAYLSQPYFVPPGDDPAYRGYPRIPRERLLESVARYHAAGLQVAVHGNGDASIDDILDAFAAAQRAQPRADARHVVIHAQTARPDQLDRMAALGVIPSFFALHSYYWGDRHRDIFLGSERAARISPARSAAERGLPFTLHCDSPVVPIEPLRLVWSAVNRRSASGAPIGSEERIGVLRALRAVTLDAARQHFEEREKGSLERGKLADLVVLDRSPLDDPAGIDTIRVLETVVGGRSAYRASEASARAGIRPRGTQAGRSRRAAVPTAAPEPPRAHR